MVYVFDNTVSNSRLYVEERIGILGSFILTAIMSFSIQKDRFEYSYKQIQYIYICTGNPSFINIFIKK
jgi:hypothetical protein